MQGCAVTPRSFTQASPKDRVNDTAGYLRPSMHTRSMTSPVSISCAVISQPLLITLSRSSGTDGLWSVVVRTTVPSLLTSTMRASPSVATQISEVCISLRMHAHVVPEQNRSTSSDEACATMSCCILSNAVWSAASTLSWRKKRRHSNEVKKKGSTRVTLLATQSPLPPWPSATQWKRQPPARRAVQKVSCPTVQSPLLLHPLTHIAESPWRARTSAAGSRDFGSKRNPRSVIGVSLLAGMSEQTCQAPLVPQTF
mmetsp:Transcript_114763/g.324334  ORF Transcript_114763/g.324334 Transcript_114763/m.324334 type:complete len:255 (+) Transcript_114763:288-1052(+)